MKYFDQLKFEEINEKQHKSFLKEVKSLKVEYPNLKNTGKLKDEPSYKASITTPKKYKIVVYTGGLAFAEKNNFEVLLFYKNNLLFDFENVDKAKVNEIIEKFSH